MTPPSTSAPAFVHALSRAASIRAIYPPGHPKVREAQAALDEAATAILPPGAERVVVAVVEGELIVNDRPMAAERVWPRAFADAMDRAGIESMGIGPGIEMAECRRLVEGLAGAEPVEPSEHVSLGRIQADTGGGESSRLGLAEHDLDRCQEAFRRLLAEPEAAAETLGHLVWGLIERLGRSRRSLLLAAPDPDPVGGLFLHSFNVALLTLAQAIRLGIRGQTLHDLGLAALLHDAGKLHLPPGLLARHQRLNDREWQVMQLHPELGAAFLAGLGSVPGLAVTVAYEHHWRWDGRPTFPIPAAPRAPGLASQLIAVADTYDASVAGPGLDGRRADGAVPITWTGRAGGQLDPVLVDSFLGIVAGVG